MTKRYTDWLQRDLSVLGCVLHSQAKGLSRLVYPALSLCNMLIRKRVQLLTHSYSNPFGNMRQSK